MPNRTLEEAAPTATLGDALAFVVPERSRSRSVPQGRAVQVPNVQFQIPEKSYTIMSYAGGQLEVEAKPSPFIDDN
ncbi:hypothetical protein [Nostoc sp.]|uniref:hypothetical protein n=1 Tax=Nostoc sp. TaxID=1180 RepID=UPI002FFA4F04